MRVATLNANGIRASHKKGLFGFLLEQNIDVLCLQEVRARPEDCPDIPTGYQIHHAPSQRRGYAGVAILTRIPATDIAGGLGVKAHDHEGRVLKATINGTNIYSIYVPSGSSGTARQKHKMRFLRQLSTYVRRELSTRRPCIFAGDYNIAHNRIDLRNWRSNQKNSGFLPEERAWFARHLRQGLADTFREQHPRTSAYSWWSVRTGARERGVGWRLDYQLHTENLTASAASMPGEPNLSDHAPVIADYTLEDRS
jgi:exodeoxyribonuclease-3